MTIPRAKRQVTETTPAPEASTEHSVDEAAANEVAATTLPPNDQEDESFTVNIYSLIDNKKEQTTYGWLTIFVKVLA